MATPPDAISAVVCGFSACSTRCPLATRQVVRGQLDHLVFVETWNGVEDAFEFAHFTHARLPPVCSESAARSPP